MNVCSFQTCFEIASKYFKSLNGFIFLKISKIIIFLRFSWDKKLKFHCSRGSYENTSFQMQDWKNLFIRIQFYELVKLKFPKLKIFHLFVKFDVPYIIIHNKLFICINILFLFLGIIRVLYLFVLTLIGLKFISLNLMNWLLQGVTILKELSFPWIKVSCLWLQK